MKDRIIEFLRTENKSSAQFADEIGVQPSGISHILSGRNKPSLDFILKMLTKYPWLSAEWLLFGKGSMTREEHFPGHLASEREILKPEEDNVIQKSMDFVDSKSDITEQMPAHQKENSQKQGSSKVIILHSNGTFEEYSPKT
jgi:transcriptional regulator with XRE-family HTH domain